MEHHCALTSSVSDKLKGVSRLWVEPLGEHILEHQQPGRVIAIGCKLVVICVLGLVLIFVINRVRLRLRRHLEPAQVTV